MKSLGSLLREWQVDPGSLLFLRCDTEVPGGRLGLVHARLGLRGEDEIKVRSTADCGALGHAGIDADELESMRATDADIHAWLSRLLLNAPLAVTYRWSARRGFCQRAALSELACEMDGREAPRPLAVLDVMDAHRAWLSGAHVRHGGSPSALAAGVAQASAASAVPAGSLLDALGEAYSTVYDKGDVCGAQCMMWALCEFYKVLAERPAFE